MGKNGMPDFLRMKGNQGGHHRGFNANAAEIVKRIMTCFELEEVTPKQVGLFFEKSPQKASGVLKAANMICSKRRNVAYYRKE